MKGFELNPPGDNFSGVAKDLRFPGSWVSDEKLKQLALVIVKYYWLDSNSGPQDQSLPS